METSHSSSTRLEKWVFWVGAVWLYSIALYYIQLYLFSTLVRMTIFAYKSAKTCFLVIDENMRLCLYIIVYGFCLCQIGKKWQAPATSHLSAQLCGLLLINHLWKEEMGTCSRMTKETTCVCVCVCVCVFCFLSIKITTSLLALYVPKFRKVKGESSKRESPFKPRISSKSTLFNEAWKIYWKWTLLGSYVD